MSETIKLLLVSLFNKELAKVTDIIRNEKLFMLGSNSEEDEEMHCSNIRDLEEYVEVLNELKKGYK